MKRLFFLIGILSLASTLPSYAQNKCDRKCLAALMERYLAALAQHNPGSVPIAADAKFVENTEKTAIKYGAFNLPAAHMFKIRNGKLYEIEAIGHMAKHGIKNGWE